MCGVVVKDSVRYTRRTLADKVLVKTNQKSAATRKAKRAAKVTKRTHAHTPHTHTHTHTHSVHTRPHTGDALARIVFIY